MAKTPQIFEKLTRARSILIIIALIFVLLIVVGIFRARTPTTGPAESRLPGVAAGAAVSETTPEASRLSPEYIAALQRAQKEQTQRALAEGKSALPLIIQDNGEQQARGQDIAVTDTPTTEQRGAVGGSDLPCIEQCRACCQEVGADGVRSFSATKLLNKLVKEGTLAPPTADALHHLQDQDVSVDEYAAKLNELVQSKSLTPAQARQLLAAYQEQHQSTARTIGRKPADHLVNRLLSGDGISSSTAQKLRDLMASNPDAAAYKAALDEMVRNGELTPEQAKQLLAAYNKQQDMVANLQPVSAKDALDQLSDDGDISSQVAQRLEKKLNQKPTVADYASELNSLVRAGQLTPEQARKLLNAYRQERAKDGDNAGYHSGTVAQMQNQGKIGAQGAEALKTLEQQGVPANEYAQKLNELVRLNKLDPTDAAKLLETYRAENGDTSVAHIKDKSMANLLAAQQKRDLAEQVDALNQLQHASVTDEVESEVQTLSGIETAIGQQVEQLFAAWNEVPTQAVVRTKLKDKEKPQGGVSVAGAVLPSQIGGATVASSALKGTMPLIKSGDVLFGSLDVTVDSDEPGPIVATIVSGKFKGAKLTGSMQRTEDNTKLILKFNTMSMQDWPNTVDINALAINADTAKYGIATDVNHHYLRRYGMLIASSFVSGYAEAIKNTGSSVLGQLGVVERTYPPLNTRERLLVAAGEVGEKASDYAKDQFNKPITVKIAAGTGIGVIFIDAVKVQ